MSRMDQGRGARSLEARRARGDQVGTPAPRGSSGVRSLLRVVCPVARSRAAHRSEHGARDCEGLPEPGEQGARQNAPVRRALRVRSQLALEREGDADAAADPGGRVPQGEDRRMTTATVDRPHAGTKKRIPKTPKPTDPVTRYARAVVERNPALVLPMLRPMLELTETAAADREARGRQIAAWTIVVGRAVRQACERHLRDLRRQKTAGFPYYFDGAAAQHIVDFF